MDYSKRREMIAALAMQAIISKFPAVVEDGDTDSDTFAEIANGAVAYADALIAALDAP